MKRTKEITDLFEKYELDNEIKNFPISTLTSCFNKLAKYTSYDMGFYDHRQAFHLIDEISKVLRVHLKEAKPNVGVRYRTIFNQHSDFVKWFTSLQIPFQKYVYAYLDLGDIDFLKGFMTDEEIKERFNDISWNNASLIVTYNLSNYQYNSWKDR